jgi:hypothetical protein
MGLRLNVVIDETLEDLTGEQFKAKKAVDEEDSLWIFH